MWRGISLFPSDAARLGVADLSGSVDIATRYGTQVRVWHEVDDRTVPLIDVCV